LTIEEMAGYGYNPVAIAGVLHVRQLDDHYLLAAARNENGPEHAAIVTFVSSDGSQVNASWVTGACAEEAYDRGLIDEQELDWTTR
jgi:hypothetical protein